MSPNPTYGVLKTSEDLKVHIINIYNTLESLVRAVRLKTETIAISI